MIAFLVGKRRILYIVFALLTIVLGLASRKYGQALPTWLATYSGDTLWALAIFFVWSAIVPARPLLRRALVALSIACVVEVSQLYQAPWINDIRQTTLGSLVLGHGFLWSDLVCYVAGVGLGIFFELLAGFFMKRKGLKAYWPSR